MSSNPGPESRLRFLWGEIRDLVAAADLLHWDQETQMPAKGLEGRSRSLATLAGLHHAKLCAPELRETLDQCAEQAEAGSPQEAQVLEARRRVAQATKIPEQLARELAAAQSQGLGAWAEARRQQDFSVFQPALETLLTLKRRQAEAMAPEGNLYDALLDEFEPGLTAEEVSPVFDQLGDALGPLVQAVAECGVTVDEAAIAGDYPKAEQRDMGRFLAESIGFDFEAGRLDDSAHPFCIGFHRNDVRLTWRHEPRDLRCALFGILHEAGHGLYEQGLPEAWEGLPLGEAVSLGIHESQSRLWENLVGRSRSFWVWALPELHRRVPGAVGVTLDKLWPALHTVCPSLIRVEADEGTYNLHVAIRFELERALFAGDLEVADLPAAWDDAYQRYLGIRASQPVDGVLQDIHWAQGSFGYFPTYTLGTLAASQIFEAARRDLGDLDAAFAAGEFAPLLSWLRTQIHQHGCRYRFQDLLVRVTGEPLTAEPFLSYLRQKTAQVYGV